MSEERVIEVQNVTKCFKVYKDRSKSIKDLLVTAGRARYEKREVLRGISFQVKKGEAVALIGSNGCGKSTTLKLVTKIIYPDTGKITVKGKVSSLLELGAGFHPDMSGRENIYLNASIFGLTKKEIDSKLDEIIRFSELEDFIDNPVRTYSSGMYMRLAFSVAINVDADVLLIDEILGVGDVSYQKKCFEKLKQIKSKGTTIVIVSHSMGQIEQICDRSIWIYEGKIRKEGPPHEIAVEYNAEMEKKRLLRADREYKKQKEEQGEGSLYLEESSVHGGSGAVKFEDIQLCNQCGEDTIVYHKNDTLILKIKISGNQKEQLASLSVSICNDKHEHYYGTNFYAERKEFLKIKGECTVEFRFEHIKLMGGTYWLNLGLYTPQFEVLDEFNFLRKFHVESEDTQGESGIFYMEHTWNTQGAETILYS